MITAAARAQDRDRDSGRGPGEPPQISESRRPPGIARAGGTVPVTLPGDCQGSGSKARALRRSHESRPGPGADSDRHASAHGRRMKNPSQSLAAPAGRLISSSDPVLARYSFVIGRRGGGGVGGGPRDCFHSA